MTEKLREHRHAFLYVNKHDLFKQKMQDALYKFQDSMTSILKDAVTTIPITFPILSVTTISSFVKEIYFYLYRNVTFDKKLRMCSVAITKEESDALYTLDQVRNNTNIELTDMERTSLILKHDIYKKERNFISQVMPQLIKQIIKNNNKIKVFLVDCKLSKSNIEKLLAEKGVIKITFPSQQMNKLIKLICRSRKITSVTINPNTSYFVVSKDDLFFIQDRIRKVTMNDLIELALTV